MAPALPRVKGVDRRISGPAGALELHLRKFRQVEREMRFLNALSDLALNGGQAVIDHTVAPGLIDWLFFASTYSKPAVRVDADGNVVHDDAPSATAFILDGRSNVEQEIVLNEQSFDQNVMLTAAEMGSVEYELLNRARTHFVSSAMRNLVTEAAELAEPEPLFASDIPCDHGLIVFEEPLLVDDLHPETGDPLGRKIMPVRAIGWARRGIGKRDGSGMTDGVVLIQYTDRDAYNEVFVKGIAPLVSSDNQPTPVGHDRWLWPVEFHPWAFGSEWSSVGRLGEQDHGKLVSPIANNRRWMLSLFRIMWQRIIKPEHWEPQTKKHFAKLGTGRRPMVMDGEGMKVLALRRFIESPHVGTRSDPDEWADWPHPYRIPVEPHWRRQHYPSLGPARHADGSWNQESHRLIFIARHARGPEHLPLKEAHQVVAVVR